MGLFGGGNSSSSTTNYNTTLDKTEADYSQVDGSQSKVQLDVANGTVSDISILDGGAIKSSFDFAGAFGSQALTAVSNTTQDALKQMDMAGQRQTETAMYALKTAQPGDTQISGDLIKYGALVVAAIVVFYIIQKGD